MILPIQKYEQSERRANCLKMDYHRIDCDYSMAEGRSTLKMQ
jgi:hypothetical protein